MKKMYALLIAGYLFSHASFAQETLQTVTDNGNTTTNNISILGTGSNFFRGSTAVDSPWIFRHRVSYLSQVTFPIGGWDAIGLYTNSIRSSSDAGTMEIIKPIGNIGVSLRIRSGTITNTSALLAGMQLLDTIVFNSNTTVAGWNALQVNPYLTQTGFSGITRGIYVNPVLTGVTDFRAVETNVVSGSGYQIYAGGTAKNYFRGTTAVDSTWSFRHDVFVGQQLFAQTWRSNSWTYGSTPGSMQLFKANLNTVADGLVIKAYSLNPTSTTRSGTIFVDTLVYNSNASSSYAQVILAPSITQTGYTGTNRGLYVNPALTGVTNFRAVEMNVSSGNGYQLYAAGSAPSIFAGSVGIGTASPSEKLHVTGNALITGKLSIGSSLRSIEDVGQSDNLSHVIGFKNSMGAGQGNPLGGFDFGDMSGNSVLRITSFNVGIGTINPQSKLAVNGDITAKKVKVTLLGWSDYVFDSSYQLAPLQQVEKYIQQNKHLPDVPSAATVKKEGIDLGDNQAVLLKKIEELTLYIIEQNKKLEAQYKRTEAQEIRIKKLEAEKK